MRVLEQVDSTVANIKIDSRDSESRSSVKRRSSRVVIEMPVSVVGQRSDGNAFREQTKTLSVSAHGALIHLKSNVDSSGTVVIVNARTQSEAQCRIAHRKVLVSGGAEIGLNFSNPLPKFWGIHFPPED